MEISLCHPAPEAFREARKLGGRLGYLDLSWALIQPAREVFDFDYYDGLVREAADLGLELIGMVSSQRGIEYFPDEHWIWEGHRGMMPEREAFGRFVEAVVERYRDTIRYWEIWSEPNCMACNPMSYYDAALCRELIEFTSRTIRGVDDTAKIILSGLWLRNLNPFYLRTLLDGGRTAEFFDIFSWHFFLMANRPENIGFELWREPLGRWVEHFRAQLPEGCPIWMTEFGLPSKPPGVERLFTRTGGEIVGLTETEQAEWFEEFAQTAAGEWGIDVLVWLMLSDEEDPEHYYIHNTGMLRADGTKKPVYEKIARLQAEALAAQPAHQGGAKRW